MNARRALLYGLALTGLVTGAAGAGAPEPAAPLPECTITFDTMCPNTEQVCRANFKGGVGCVIENQLFCYDTGTFSYKVDPDQRLRIGLAGDLNELVVFFVEDGPAEIPGEMRFFDRDGLQVGDPLFTNGDCTAFMPDRQTVVFERPVRHIEVRAGDTGVFIDTFEVNPSN